MFPSRPPGADGRAASTTGGCTMAYRTLTTLTTLVLAGLVATACSDPVAAPVAAGPPSLIINGAPTGNAYASVGALMFDYGGDGISGDDEWCTGSLISPTVFLTAAHCVVTPYTPPGSQFYVTFAADLYSKSAKFIKAVSYTYDPAYGHDQANLHDLAVIILPEGSTKGITPYRLPTRGELDVLSAKGALTDAIFVNVGYGVSATQTG